MSRTYTLTELSDAIEESRDRDDRIEVMVDDAQAAAEHIRRKWEGAGVDYCDESGALEGCVDLWCPDLDDPTESKHAWRLLLVPRTLGMATVRI